MSTRWPALAGVSSLAPCVIHWRINAMSADANGFPDLGISTWPLESGVICAIRWLSSGLPGTIPTDPESPGFAIRATSVITKPPSGLAG